MRYSVRLLIGCAFAAAFSLGVAHAQSTDKLWKSCTTSAKSPDAGVAACSKLLARGSKLPKADQVIALLNRAVGHYAAQRYQESIDDNSAALSLDPKSAIGYSNRADGYFSTNRFQEAVQDYTAALELDNSLNGAYQWRGHSLFALGRYDESIKDFNVALQNNPQLPAALYDRGRANALMGRYAESLPDYDAAIAQDASIANYHYDRAIALHNLQRYSEAEASYDAALAREPNHGDAMTGKAGIKLDTGDLVGAEAGYRAALAIVPKSTYALTGMGNTLVRLERTDEALPYFDTAIAQGNATTWQYTDRARARIIMGKADAAIDDTNQALQLYADNSDALYLRGLCKRVRGDFEGAAADLDASIAKTPNYIWSISARAELLIREDELTKAKPFLAKILEISDRELAKNGLSQAVINEYKAFRGWARALTGQRDAGIVDLNIVIDTAKEVSTAHYFRGVVRYQEGDYAGAAEDFAAAQGATRSIYSKAQNRIERARALEKLNRFSDAKIAYEEALQLVPAFIEARLGLERVRIAAANPVVVNKDSDAGKAEDLALLQLKSLEIEKQKEPKKVYDLGKRVALVIGNGNYSAVAQLPNPSRDAEKIAETLRSVGFTNVTVANDLTHDTFNATLRKFAREADGADWAVVYYAGHGIEVNNTNYLVPIDASLAVDRDLEFEAVPLDRVVRSVEGAKKLRIVILDACRENPFDAKMQRTTSTRSVSRGLARVEPEGGTLIAYAAKAGEVALDGDSENSPFVIALTDRMKTPGLEIGKLFRLVRDDVLSATGRKQEPFLYGSLPGDDLFVVPPE
jgi:tetratricopeptide (TPR) repeat protein